MKSSIRRVAAWHPGQRLGRATPHRHDHRQPPPDAPVADHVTHPVPDADPYPDTDPYADTDTDHQPTATPTGPTGTCAPAWSPATSYTTGQQVSYKGDIYTAAFCSTGAAPDASTSWAVWHDDGSCTG